MSTGYLLSRGWRRDREWWMSPSFAVEWANFFADFNRYVATFLIAMLPVAELRGAIPFAWSQDIPWWQAYLVAVAGNMVPVFFILWLLDPVSRWLMKRSKLFNRFFNWLFDRTRRKLEKKYEIYAELALAAFVAIPLPVTGAWTGSVAAFVFDIPYRKALFWVFIGVLVAGVIVTAVMGSSVSIFRFFRG